ncbi:MAG: hypothetical protein ABEH88_09690 [Halobacteriales archaeon]
MYRWSGEQSRALQFPDVDFPIGDVGIIRPQFVSFAVYFDTVSVSTENKFFHLVAEVSYRDWALLTRHAPKVLFRD